MRNVVEYIINGISLGSLYALFALGIAVIYGIMRLINFAHGTLIMVGAYVLVFATGPAEPIRIAAVLLATVIVALLMDRVAFRPVRGANDDTLLVTSFAISIFLQSLAIFTIGSQPRSAGVLVGLTGTVSVFGASVGVISIITVGLTAFLLAVLGVFLHRTTIGIQMRAAAENFRMARLVGVRANVVIAASFAISGILAGVASVILVAQTGIVGPNIGTAPLLAAFVATILGGLGSLRSAVVGGYVLGAVTIILQVALPVSLRPYREAFVFGALIVILVFRPEGLLPSRAIASRV